MGLDYESMIMPVELTSMNQKITKPEADYPHRMGRAEHRRTVTRKSVTARLCVTQRDRRTEPEPKGPPGRPRGQGELGEACQGVVSGPELP